MKKILLILPVIFCLFGCTKKVPADLDPINVEGVTLINSNIESLLLGGDERVWPEGAYVGVFGSTSGNNEQYVLQKADAGLTTAQFYGPNVKGDVISAYFPYDPSYAGSTESMPVSLSSSQVFNSEFSADEQFLYYSNTAFAFFRDNEMNFQYPFGMLKIGLDLDEPASVDRIAVYCQDYMLAGMGQIQEEDGLVMSESASHIVSLECEGYPSKVAGERTYFYLTLVPGEYSVLNLMIYMDGVSTPVTCAVRDIYVPRISATQFVMASVVVKGGGLTGYESVSQQFDK